jgi:hypothetical protein
MDQRKSAVEREAASGFVLSPVASWAGVAVLGECPADPRCDDELGGAGRVDVEVSLGGGVDDRHRPDVAPIGRRPRSSKAKPSESGNRGGAGASRARESAGLDEHTKSSAPCSGWARDS